MNTTAQANQVRISARKIRFISDSIKNKSIDDSLSTLQLIHRRGASVLEKLIRSAVANAVNNGRIEKSSLSIERIDVTEGTPLKRFHASTRGRIHPYKKKSSHIRVVLKEKGGTAV